MITTRKIAAPGAVRTVVLRNQIALSSALHGSKAAYRLSLTRAHILSRAISSQSFDSSPTRIISRPGGVLLISAVPLRSVWPVSRARRSFQSAAALWQQQQQQYRKSSAQDVKASSSKTSSASEETSANNKKPQGSEEFPQQAKDEAGAKEEASREDADKEAPPPPPPHGDKTPWQVFTETLRSEFKASKEWNESTKALASSAHHFTESESVKRARAAYEAASDAASTKTSSALRGTGKALGRGAAWTWDTSVVKGLRSGVAATGKGIEKATRPVRATKAYKTAVGGVKDVMDDGSSSRYGGWIEKEERRKQRELRELNEAKSGHKIEKMEEDPKWVGC
jgi:import inner membrane translocase subunit TIM44